MRKGFIICLLLMAALSAMAARTGRMSILGNVCEYDTVLYRTIAPGATLLQVRFDAIKDGAKTYDMLGHIIEIDMTNPYNKFTPKLSCNGYYEWTSVLMELQSEQRAARRLWLRCRALHSPNLVAEVEPQRLLRLPVLWLAMVLYIIRIEAAGFSTITERTGWRMLVMRNCRVA